MNEMQEWQKRVVEERKELGAKIDRLREFMCTSTFDQLKEAERERLFSQRSAMVTYHAILERRIAAFE